MPAPQQLHTQITTYLMQEARKEGLIGQEILDYLDICKRDGHFDQLILDEERRLEYEEVREKREVSKKNVQLKIK